MFFFDIRYFIIALPAFLLALYAQAKVRSTYSKYSQVLNSTGMTGAQTARRLLEAAGIHDVQIERIPGDLTDNYDPSNKVLHLSDSTYDSNSVAAIGVTAHEVGHAIQDATAYAPMRLRTGLVPVAGIGSQLGIWLFFIGMILSAYMRSPIGFEIATVGLILFSAVALFAGVTLPVEFNASNRAMALLEANGLVTPQDYDMAKQVLNAAALTYVAGFAQALSQVIYYAMILSGMRRRD